MERKFGVAEQVISVIYGVGIVVCANGTPDKPVTVKYHHLNVSRDYTADGKAEQSDVYPEIYKQGDLHPFFNITINMPKPKVQAVADCWVNIIPGYDMSGANTYTDQYSLHVHATKKEAQDCFLTGSQISPAKLIFEVEE